VRVDEFLKLFGKIAIEQAEQDIEQIRPTTRKPSDVCETHFSHSNRGQNADRVQSPVSASRVEFETSADPRYRAVPSTPKLAAHADRLPKIKKTVRP